MASTPSHFHRCDGVGYENKPKTKTKVGHKPGGYCVPASTRQRHPQARRHQTAKGASDYSPSFPAPHETPDSPEEDLPTILITAEDLGLTSPIAAGERSCPSSPPPAKSPRTAEPPVARPKTASSPRRSRQPQMSTSRNARPMSSRSPRSSGARPRRRRSHSGGGDRRRSGEGRARPTPAWSATELPDDGCTATGGYEDTPEPSELEMSWSSLQTPSEGQTAGEDLDESFSEGNSSLRSDDPIRKLVEGLAVDDADYDTDLEEEFAPEKEMIYDSAGKNIYLAGCKEEGVDPSRYVLRHLQETTFRMRHRYISLQALIPLAKAFKSNTCTETLDLSDNHLEGDGASVIAYMMRDNCYITTLDVSENQIRSSGASGFASMLETNYTLKTLCLRANHLTDRDALRLSEGLKSNSTLTEIDLSHNDLGELAGVHLASALASNDGLAYLDLKWNGIREKGIIAMANSLKVNTALEVLDLSQNGASLSGCAAFLQALKVNTGLRVLDLSFNHITTLGAKKLALGLKKNTTLEALLLGGNPIGDEGVMTVLKSCPLSTNLKLLSLQEITLSLAVHQKLHEVQETCNLHILCRDYSGHKRTVAVSHLVAMVDQFIMGHQARILYRCFSSDEERSCSLSSKAIAKVLIDAGVDLSQEQIDNALQHVGEKHSSSLQYRPLLDGLSALQRRATVNSS